MGGKFDSEARALARIRRSIRDVPDFPTPGILFKDITPLLADARLFRTAVRLLRARVARHAPVGLVGIESRGFLFAAPLAVAAGLPLQLVRKPGKLPHDTAGYEYALEYGTDRIEIHLDAIAAGQRYAVVDDLLATGGTAAAAAQLVEQQGGVVACCAFLIELGALSGRRALARWPVESLLCL